MCLGLAVAVFRTWLFEWLLEFTTVTKPLASTSLLPPFSHSSAEKLSGLSATPRTLPALPRSPQPQEHNEGPLPELGVSGSPASSAGISLGLPASRRLLCCRAEGSERTGQPWGGSSGAGAHLQQHLAGLQPGGYVTVGALEEQQLLKGVPGLGVELGAESG